MEHFQHFIGTYGYIAIFILLVMGIAGVPAPEESMMVFVGITISQGSLNFSYSLLAAFLGTCTGMLLSYTIGFWIGQPFLKRFGKYFGMSGKRWEKATRAFEKYAFWAVAFGFFVPGIRQVNPYMAGISRVAFIPYLIAGTIGAAIWTAVFLSIGYFLGYKLEALFTFTPKHIAIGLFALLILFILSLTIFRLLFRKQPD
ncbi:DedA family protein [Camelliibacillus cellulosilyticus]|uniref:DedA family protein n=1 Tax=Camelliibacillus cellulosilyticus TaxID=2174486 RepID=A0ABV9GL53_9BACL